MRKIVTLIIIMLSCFFYSHAQVENVFVITTDGLRWQEVFGGMDTAIANNKKFSEGNQSYLLKKYWHTNAIERRKLLMPFFWSTLEAQGQIHGNRKHSSYVNVANPYWFSYPGYSETFNGYVDTAVNSNAHPANKNVSVLEFLHQQNGYKNKVVAFAAWIAFDRIFNEQRCGFPVINAFDTVAGNRLTTQQQLINNMLSNSYKPWMNGECLDVFTHYAAMEYIKTNTPKVVFIGYGDTDEFAHAGKYRSYLDATHQFDKWVGEIWQWIQQHPKYKNKTAILLTTDHGRGDIVKTEWTDHGSDVAGASQTWMAAIGKGIAPKGETKNIQMHNQQVAATIASLLGFTYKANHPVAAKIEL